MKATLIATSLTLALTLTGGTAFAQADAKMEAVRKAIEQKTGEKVESVTKAPLGLYEVFVNGELIYTDEGVNYIFAGNLFDAKTMQSLTQARMQKLSSINFSELPLDLAIKQVRGKGTRVIALFEDPNCGYCKRFAKDLQKVEDLTVYSFVYPILGKDSLDKSKSVWCSADRTKAWRDWMLDGVKPAAAPTCDTGAIQKIVDLGRKLRVNGTPTIFYADGTRVGGAIPVAKLEEQLKTVGKN